MARDPKPRAWLTGGLLVAVGWVATIPDAQAVPAWARKYDTSCQTCHLAFPFLTPFGEAFRRNGHRFPEAADEDFREQSVVELGAEAYKRVFPDSVWPADLAAVPAFAAVLEGQVNVVPGGVKGERAGVDFNDLGAGFELLAAGTIGDTISYFAELELEASGPGNESEGVEFARLWATYAPFGPRALVRAGQFEPTVLNTSAHRRLTPTMPAATRLRFFDNMWSLEAAQRGFEVTGVCGRGRLGYTAGIVEGNRNPHDRAKDYYGSLSYKVGGMRQDGVAPEGNEGDPTASSQPWSERSARAQVFLYRGTAQLMASGPEFFDRFWSAGGDVRVRYDDFILDGGFVWRDDDQPSLANPGKSARARVVFVEGDYVVFPWLIPSVRWDRVEQDSLPGIPRDHSDIFTASMVLLIRANVRVQAGWQKTTHAEELSGIGSADNLFLVNATIAV